jgi:hypothetical protein
LQTGLRLPHGRIDLVGQLKVDHPPALRGSTPILWDLGAEADGQAIEARWAGATVGSLLQIGSEQLAVALGHDHLSGSHSLHAQPIQFFMNLKTDPIGVGVLTKPATFPKAPAPSGLQVYQLLLFGIRLKCTMARAEVGIGQGEGRNRLPTVGALNAGAEDRVGKGNSHRKPHKTRLDIWANPQLSTL